MHARSPRLSLRVALYGALILVASPAPSGAAPIRFRTVVSAIPKPFYQSSVAADFDGDGHPDLAGMHSNDSNGGTVEWRGNSGGALGAAQPVAFPFPVHTIAAGDLNGDGRADLVGCGASSGGGAVAVVLAHAGGFDAAFTVPTDSAGVVAATVADLDGDGDLDVVAANRLTRMVHRLFNDGTGHFAGLASTHVTGEVSRTWVADLDGDGKADILTGNWPHLSIGAWQNAVSWFLKGTGGGGFAAPASTGIGGFIALGAFTAPGAHDAFVFSSGGYGIASDLHSGAFAAPVLTAGLAGCAEPFGAPIDLDGDGRDEIVTASGGGCTTPGWGIYRVDGAGALVRRERYSGQCGLEPAIADLDGNGLLDVVVSGATVVRNHGGRLDGARLLASYDANVVNPTNDLQEIEAGDLDHNGTADVLIATRFLSGMYFRSNPDGTFRTGLPWQSNSYVRELAIADLDGDGDLDVLQRHNDPGLTNHLYTAINDGAGNLAAGSTTTFPVTGSSGLVVQDFDGDGDLDALSSGGSPAAPYLFLNDGAAHFGASPCSPPFGFYGPVGGDPRPGRFSAVADTVQVERSTGTCTLAAPIRAWVGGPLVTARFADVDHDGCTDAVCLRASGDVATLLGLPGGGWAAPIVSPGPVVPAGYAAVFANVGDLDGDGRLDLLFTGAGTPAVISVLRNIAGGVFGERGDSYTTQSFGTVIADVDGDGAGDLLGQEPNTGGQSTTNAANLLFGFAPDGPVAAQVALASADATFEGASLAWFVPAGGPAALTLERDRNGSGWSTLATVTPIAGRITWEDRTVEPGTRYAWRLTWQEDGAAQHSDVATLVIPRRPRFAITGVQPNPADGDRVSVSLTLDRSEPVDLSVVDIAGRIVASRRVTPGATGRVEVALDGLTSLRPALYFVRAEQAGHRATATLVRLH